MAEANTTSTITIAPPAGGNAISRVTINVQADHEPAQNAHQAEVDALKQEVRELGNTVTWLVKQVMELKAKVDGVSGACITVFPVKSMRL